MSSPPHDDRASDAEHVTWKEISAFDMLLRDREAYLRRRGWWHRLGVWRQTELLESLRAKMRRIFHTGNFDGS